MLKNSFWCNPVQKRVLKVLKTCYFSDLAFWSAGQWGGYSPPPPAPPPPPPGYATALASRASANSKDAFNSARLLASSICRISQDLLVLAVGYNRSLEKRLRRLHHAFILRIIVRAADDVQFTFVIIIVTIIISILKTFT